MINQKVILQFGDFAAHRLASSGIGSLWANLGDEDPGLLLDRLGGGQPRLRNCVWLSWSNISCRIPGGGNQEVKVRR